MGMAYSLAPREKIVRAHDGGGGARHAIAELFGIPRSFVEKLLARCRTATTQMSRRCGSTLRSNPTRYSPGVATGST